MGHRIHIFAPRTPCLIAIAMLLLAVAVMPTRAGELSESDKMTIRDVIRAQIDAFKIDDAATAFSYATPTVQTRSGTAEAFLAMVKRAYQPVYRPRAVFFQDITVMDGIPTQRVLLMDTKGAPVLAIYPMERQPDGHWRIAGCMLYRGDEQMP